MENVTAKFKFTLLAADGTQLHNTELEYNGLDEQQVLWMEKHLMGTLNAMNGEATEVAKGKALAKGKAK